jgi:hypothetical protein
VPDAAPPAPRSTPSPARALAGAVTAALGLAMVGYLAHSSATVRWADAAALHGFDQGEGRFGLTGVCERLAHLADPASFLLLGTALFAVAVIRGQYRVAAAVPVVLLGANLTTQFLKPAVASPRLSEWLGNGQIPAASWPSGHSTASMSLVLCAILVSSPRLRALVATVGAFVAVGALRAADRRWPARTGRAVAVRLGEALAPPLLAVFAAFVAAVGVVALRPDAVIEASRGNESFVAGAFMIAGLGLAVATALVLVLRR